MKPFLKVNSKAKKRIFAHREEIFDMLQIQTPNAENRVLLHSYCTPCSSAIIECTLANNIPSTVFYRNLNIYPREEK